MALNLSHHHFQVLVLAKLGIIWLLNNQSVLCLSPCTLELFFIASYRFMIGCQSVCRNFDDLLPNSTILFSLLDQLPIIGWTLKLYFFDALTFKCVQMGSKSCLGKFSKLNHPNHGLNNKQTICSKCILKQI